MKTLIVQKVVILLILALTLSIFFSCNTTNNLEVYWVDENGSIFDSKTYEAINDGLFIQNIREEFKLVKTNPSSYHSIYLLSKVYITAFPNGEYIDFVQQLMIISGLFSIRYNPYIQEKHYDFQKTYIGLGYIKEIIQQIANMDTTRVPYMKTLAEVLETGYWHDEAIKELIIILESIIQVDFDNHVVSINSQASQIERNITIFQEKFRKWYDDTQVNDLFVKMELLP